MKKWLLSLLMLGSASVALAEPIVPSHNHKPLVDAADIFSPSQEDEINQTLLGIEKSTSHQVMVLTMTNLENSDPAMFANKAFSKYKIGDASRDDGVLMLVSMANPRRIQIEVGYGLEGVLTDAQSGRITKSMVPAMRQGDYKGAVITGLDAIQVAIQEEQVVLATENATKASDSGIFIAFGLGGLLLLIFLIGTVQADRSRRQQEEREREAYERAKLKKLRDAELERQEKTNQEQFKKSERATFPKSAPDPVETSKVSQSTRGSRPITRPVKSQPKSSSYSSNSYGSSSRSSSSRGSTYSSDDSYRSSSSDYGSSSSDWGGGGGSSGGGGGGSDW